MTNRTPADIVQAADIISAMDSPLRLQIVILLNERDHVVHELVNKLDKSQPLISQHLRVLKRSGLVDSERSGREVTYRLASPRVIELFDLSVELSSELKASA